MIHASATARTPTFTVVMQLRTTARTRAATEIAARLMRGQYTDGPVQSRGTLSAMFTTRRTFCVLAMAAAATAALVAQPGPTLPAETLLARQVIKALDDELSGASAKEHVVRLAQHHRVPASPGFHNAIEYVMERAKSFGLADVHVETFPGDGKTYFGTLHGNRGWRVEGGSLDEVSPQARRIT